ncbi:MRL1 [Symbiodinium sp. CCMP2592]|nr:MRL1 [Symbiodinium sp. CCMP2592]
MPFSDFSKVQNVRPEVSLDGDGCDGFAFDEEELNAALGKLEKLDILAAATPTSTDCPDEELMDFLDEDEKEAEREPSEEDLVFPVISNASAIRRCRLREDRRQMVREYLAKHGFQDANQPKSMRSSFFRTETIYPIHHAAKLGHHLMVRELLRFGVDREVTTSRGRTAYDLAAEADMLGSHRTVLDLLSGVWNSTTLRDLKEMLDSNVAQVARYSHLGQSRTVAVVISEYGGVLINMIAVLGYAWHLHHAHCALIALSI